MTTGSARLAAATSRYILAHARDDLPAMLRAATAMEPLVAGLEPGILPFGPVRADALSRLGRAAEAESVLAEYAELAARTVRESATMHVARVRGQIAAHAGDYATAAAHLRAAAALARLLGLPLQVGLAELRLAECLHPYRRTVAATTALNAAAEAFSAIGATAYVEQARAFGDRVGIDLSSLSGHPFAALSRAQRAVAMAVLAGWTNAQIGNKGGRSAKTVETHLSNISRDLGCQDRSGLRRYYLDRDGVLPEPGS